MTYGAVSTAFFVYEDLLHYKGGVYKHEEGVRVGAHAITVVGWGRKYEADRTKYRDYWII